MSKEYTIIVHTIAEDGLPPEDEEKAGLIGRVAFIFDGNIYCGWPLGREQDAQWQDSEVETKFNGVKKWIELPVHPCNMGEERETEQQVSEPEKHMTTIGERWDGLEIEWSHRGGYRIVDGKLVPDTRPVVSFVQPATIASERRPLINMTPRMAENLRLWLESQKGRIHELLEQENKP